MSTNSPFIESTSSTESRHSDLQDGELSGSSNEFTADSECLSDSETSNVVSTECQVGESTVGGLDVYSADSGANKSNHESKWRGNTLEEKRRMRRKRKQEKRRLKMEKKRKEEEEYLQKAKTEAKMYRSMARTFWDRWQWELLKRREAMQQEIKAKAVNGRLNAPPLGEASSGQVIVPEVDPAQLIDPIQDGKLTEVWLGRGSFSVVRLQMYRGIKVAVKEFLPRTVREDVKHEAAILSLLTHPYLPYIFGVCTRSRPYRIILQFHGIDSKTVTLRRELSEHPIGIAGPMGWLVVCVQILEAVEYIHGHKILHNDIKSDNILITTTPFGSLAGASIAASRPSTYDKAFDQHIVLVDFGKATLQSEGRRYNLSEPEKVEYMVKYTHIAPEVVHGESKQSTYSDMYSIGKIFQTMFDCDCFRMFPNKAKEEFLSITSHVKSIHWQKRPCAQKTLKMIDKLLL